MELVTPKRVQYQRGVSLPPDTVYVGRPTPWGNPFRVRQRQSVAEVAAVVTKFAQHLEGSLELLALARRMLAGSNLACWCPTDQPFCHADVWLQEVNPASSSLALHRRAEYWMGVADCLQAGDQLLLAAARRFAARWERETFAAIPVDRPRTRGTIALAVASLLVKAGENAEAHVWIEDRANDATVPLWAQNEMWNLLGVAS